MRLALPTAILVALVAASAAAAGPDPVGPIGADKPLPELYGLAPEFSPDETVLGLNLGDPADKHLPYPKNVPEDAIAVLKEEQAASHAVDLGLSQALGAVDAPVVAGTLLPEKQPVAEPPKPSLRGSLKAPPTDGQVRWEGAVHGVCACVRVLRVRGTRGGGGAPGSQVARYCHHVGQHPTLARVHTRPPSRKGG
jgi:hypothetical protein